MTTHTFRAGFLACGLGAGARGFVEARAALGTSSATFLNAGGIDIDEAGLEDFRRLANGPAIVGDIHTMQPADLIAAWGPDAPDAVFSSTPCKGLSRLLGAAAAEREEYQALNRLTVEALHLVVSTYPKKPPKLIILENVPGIMSRGADLLDKIRQLLTAHGYRLHESTHDCGELGGLGQHRRRYLMVARHEAQLPALLYQPVRQRVKACGEIIGPLPLPNDSAAGPLHVLPRISWINWVRLALIPPGGDWRDLPRAITTHAENPDAHRNKHAVGAWDEPSGAVIGATRPGSGAPSVADARVAATGHHGSYGVLPFDRPAKVVTSGAHPSTGPQSVADPRLPLGYEARRGAVGVLDWERPSRTVTGSIEGARGSNSAGAVADPRVAVGATGANAASFKGRPGYLGVDAWEAPAPAVTGNMGATDGTTPGAVADPRLTSPLAEGQARREVIRRHKVQAWNEPHPTVTGPGANAVENVADVRLRRDARGGVMGVTPFDVPAATVTGESYPSNGSANVADPRVAVTGWPNKHASKYRVRSFDEPVGAVTGETDVQEGAPNVADPRIPLTCAPRSGAYGVADAGQPIDTVTGSASIDNGRVAVADGRELRPLPPGYRIFTIEEALALATSPKAKPDKGVVPVIFSPHDGTWHRPLTTLELAALQGLPPVLDGKPLTLAGNSSAAHRERIGNAVPVGTARAIAGEMLRTLLAGALGLFVLGSTPIWVRHPYARRTFPRGYPMGRRNLPPAPVQQAAEVA